MSIVYACVAYLGTVVSTSGRLTEDDRKIAGALLLARDLEGRSYEADARVFHCVHTGDYTFMCVAPAEFPRRFCLAFLDEVKAQFRPETAERFYKVINALRKRYKSAKDISRVEDIKTELGKVRETMKDNVGQLVERGDRIGELEVTATLLETEARDFRINATRLRETFAQVARRRRILIWIGAIAVIAVAGVGLVLGVCDIDLHKCPTK